MKISAAAKASGLTVKTVRYYANIGLVCPAVDPATGSRAYSENDIAKLQFVGTARRFDFSIDDCRELLALYEDKARPSREVKKIAMNKIADIEKRLAALQALKAELVSLAQACDGDDRPHCPIIDGLARRVK